MAVTFGLGLPVLALLVGGAVDLAEVMKARVTLQRAVDSAALTGAKQMISDRSSATTLRTESFGTELAKQLEPRWNPTTTAEMDAAKGTMVVTQTASRASLFGTLTPPWTVTVTATATQVGGRPLCVLGLLNASANVVEASGTSVLDASACLVQSNGDMRTSGGTIRAGTAQSVLAATGSITPAPVTDVPPLPDPFATVPINVPNTCDDFGLALSGSGTITLNPGVHCGAYILGGTTKVVLNPGEHYFLNGLMLFNGQAQLTGTDVVVVFKGLSSIMFTGKASMSLDGRQSGPLSGFVMITDRSYVGSLSISTDSAHRLHGAVYLPNATLDVSGSANKIADQSPWTIVVAQRVKVGWSATLMINANYSASPIMAPGGLGPNGVRLTN